MLDEEDNFIKENFIVYKEYKIILKIREKAIGNIYLEQVIENNAYTALNEGLRKFVKQILLI